MTKRLIILRGLPGSGKTTFAEFLNANVFDLEIFAADNYQSVPFDPNKVQYAHASCQRDVGLAMGRGVETVVVHNTNTQAWEMKPYEDMAEQFGYMVTHLIVENRHGSKSVHNVPKEVLVKMKDRFETQLIPDAFVKGGIFGQLVLDQMTLHGVIHAQVHADQRPDFHPEGNVFVHTAMVAYNLKDDIPELFWAGVLHDLGKRDVAGIHKKKGHITHYGHTQRSLEILDHYVQELDPLVNWEMVGWLIEHHMERHKLKRGTEDHVWFPYLQRFFFADDMLWQFENLGEGIKEEALVWFNQWLDDGMKTPIVPLTNHFIHSGSSKEERKERIRKWFGTKSTTRETTV